MSYIETTLTTAGNSVAVRLPSDLLQKSGLGKRVRLEAKEGVISIHALPNPRAGWGAAIAGELKTGALKTKDKYGDLVRQNNNTLQDGLTDEP